MLRNNHSKDDSIKSAIYNPKEFRRIRVDDWDVESSKTATYSHSSYRYFPFFFALFFIAVVIYSWVTHNRTLTLPIPNSGVVQRYYDQSAGITYAPLQLKADGSDFHYLLKLEDLNTGMPVLDVFVRKGENVNIQVPIGIYLAKYAYGREWYGFSYLFGTMTKVVRVIQPLRFALKNNQVTGLTIDFNLKVTGNLHTTEVDKSSF